jgi:hypothetical protein
MHQKDLFDNAEQRDTNSTQAGSDPIHSGRVGIVRFGATKASFALIQEALADLAAPPPEADQNPS